MLTKKNRLKKAKKQTKIIVPPRRMLVDAVAIRRRLCMESYWDFVKIFWHEIIAETPVWNWHMRVGANELQKAAETVFDWKPKEYDLIMNWPPGTSKSTFCSIMLLPWCWTRLPSFRYIGGSFDSDLSVDLGMKSRKIVKSKLYQETFPDIRISEDQDAKSYFTNTKGGERRSTSTGSSITGRHAHMIVVDDPINPAGVRSLSDIEAANVWMTETLPSRCVDQSITPMVLVMQRLAVDDPTGHRLNRTDGVPVRHICFPAELSDEVKPAKYKKKYKYGLLDPKRLPRMVLANKRAELGNYGYAGQFEQRPVPLSGGMFKWEKFLISDPPPLGAFERVIRWWDKAATKEGDGAYTSGVLMGILKSPTAVPRFWVLDVIRGRWDTNQREDIIKQTALADREFWQEDENNKVSYEVGLEQEPGSGGKDSAKGTTANLAGFKVIAERATGDKFERADPYSVQVNSGNVGLARGKWNRAYIDEHKHFGPGCKFKDQVDASSGPFNRLTKKKLKAGAAGF